METYTHRGGYVLYRANMSQRYFEEDDPAPRYCNTHERWVDDFIHCPDNCCNGWKLRKALELCLPVKSNLRR
jgi:hypothetical protein